MADYDVECLAPCLEPEKMTIENPATSKDPEGTEKEPTATKGRQERCDLVLEPKAIIENAPDEDSVIDIEVIAAREVSFKDKPPDLATGAKPKTKIINPSQENEPKGKPNILSHLLRRMILRETFWIQRRLLAI